ncbi:CelD/BcsL family acetyltransferase involved in cellulose biosynthesis [Rhizobium tibeticum]|uniref:Acetyltransferase involved in cellulose biosynthesis, CelD/BcsL family n=1 Tax=Rhizobium tibeticum TaxID=501024 RepID=A0A1H8GP16_9HYPH|nr:GNAT family N-acetyltransferase [Rhizobium tibeticum]MDP9808553.1 CelD/BcsL family acetyltransferase involved in cellulose biosynthesis [Rhizobium tibeticum]SEH62754.1 Protein involved in cellulose biosynthesis (CelD) [Rhizobium tibeticum]SEN45247.1 Acetyltransferase involved in cellulose biosynthesis, CelD/BcsL family [Rhizobium tibeticum]
MQAQKLPIAHKAHHSIESNAGVSELRALNAQLAVAELDIVVLHSLEPLEEIWRELDRDDLNSLHQGYDWCVSWAKAHGNPLSIVWGRLGEETAFILPIEINRFHGFRTARFVGADHSNINTGLFTARFIELATNLEPAKFAELLRRALVGSADLLLLQNIPLEWRGCHSPLALLPMVKNQNHAYHLPLLANMESTLQQVNAKGRRKKFRTQLRRLEALGGFDYISSGTSGEQHRLLDRFFEQKGERLSALGLPDVFEDPQTKAFLHGALDIRDPDSKTVGLEMHAIRLKGAYDGHIAALAGISRKGDHIICQFSAIDESLAAETSPGEFLFWQMIAGQHGKGVDLFDFGLGDQRYKRSWAPVETEHYDVVLPLSLRGRVGGLVHRAITRGKAFAKSRPKIYHLAQRIHRVIGV